LQQSQTAQQVHNRFNNGIFSNLYLPSLTQAPACAGVSQFSEFSMFKPVYESEDFGYRLIEETGDFILTTKKFKISFTITGEFAKLFSDYIELLNNKPAATLNKRIEKVIGIHLFFAINSALGDKGQNIVPQFIE
jgi:hypothetical protein